jgi:hypothetical protein
MKVAQLRKGLITAAIGAVGVLGAGQASAIVVGGVDFGVLGGSPFFSHQEQGSVFETIVAANGDILSGYGQVSLVNGATNYSVPPGKSLYYKFTGYQVANITAATADFIGGNIDVFLLPTFNLLTQDSPTNLGLISGTPWLQLQGRPNASGFTLQSNGTITGSNIAFTGSGLLDVVGGLPDVVAFLDSNSIFVVVAGLADMVLTSSGSTSPGGLNPVDIAGFPGATLAEKQAFCSSGQAPVGSWCLGGSADLRGTTNEKQIPEPTSLALVGLSLFGLAAARRRREGR